MSGWGGAAELVGVVCPNRMRRLDSALAGALHENLGNGLPCGGWTRSSRKLEHLGAIERVSDTERLGRGRIKRGRPGCCNYSGC